MPTDEKDATEELYRFFNTEFPAVQPGVTIVRENDRPVPIDAETEWVRMIVRGIDSEHSALSDSPPNREWRVWGAIVCEVFTMPRDGWDRINTICRDIAKIWREATSAAIDGITTRAPQVIGGAVVEDGAFYNKLVRVPYFYDIRG